MLLGFLHTFESNEEGGLSDRERSGGTEEEKWVILETDCFHFSLGQIFYAQIPSLSFVVTSLIKFINPGT